MATTHPAVIHQAMMRPDSYPHPVNSIQRRETHISTVYLTGSFVYKIKKPVDLGFADFSTLDKRLRCCRREVALNRRLSHGVYVDVVPITCHGGRYRVDGPGNAVEFAVKMRQLAESDVMVQRLRDATLTNAHIDALIHRLVDFYTDSATNCTVDADALASWEENLQYIDKFAGVWIDRPPFEFVHTASQAFARTHHSLFERRRINLKIKDCHGDLRTDHIYFTSNGIQVIDCIEFNEHLRCLDVISDLAFLAMDLEANGFAQTAGTLVWSYIEMTEDVGAIPLLDFYRCYRAMVRCKVSCFRLEEEGLTSSDRKAFQESAVLYLAMAQKYAIAFSRPVLWVVCGLPASGKSTIAKALAAVYDISVIRSDVVRKALYIDQEVSAARNHGNRGRYSAIATETTYNRLLLLADERLKKGGSIVLDATFSRRAHRVQASRLAERRQAKLVFVECQVAEPMMIARLRQRETLPSVSDARLVHLDAFKKRYEPFEPFGGSIHIRVNTAGTLQACLQQVLLTALLTAGSEIPDRTRGRRSAPTGRSAA